eukprot:s4205_g10.t1
MSVTHKADWDLCVVHTSQPILSAENLVDLQRFMGELDRAGRESHFWKMWGAVCLSQMKSLRIFPVVAARYPCAASFAWRPSADDATKVVNAPPFDLYTRWLREVGAPGGQSSATGGRTASRGPEPEGGASTQ